MTAIGPGVPGASLHIVSVQGLSLLWDIRVLFQLYFTAVHLTQTNTEFCIHDTA